MCQLAKADYLPDEPDELMWFYLRQIILEPKEIALEFSRIAFLEKRARQEAWLALGKHVRRKDGSGDILSLNDLSAEDDVMQADEYDPAAALDKRMNK